MMFLYRYYYHFFKLHRRDELAGVNKNIPWFSALIQIVLATLCFLLGLYWGLTWLFGVTSKTGGLQKHHIFFLLPACFAAWYYILFDLLKVDKVSGRTDALRINPEEENSFLYWVIWFGSVLLPVVIAVFKNT
ncbi:hypothetical protein [Dyadobacter sp. CY323]|uniref:hypothetical protein n=1 Tax=Dyadobacter sp. CY323 TaxID=2907302 RepID=UPI001F402E6A|nr:hypothetical protein [Dyadobacter sp. CY323]MCE6991199.1 hypothetical protein [Dyadobacter sp. CY323]